MISNVGEKKCFLLFLLFFVFLNELIVAFAFCFSLSTNSHTRNSNKDTPNSLVRTFFMYFHSQPLNHTANHTRTEVELVELKK